MPSNQSSNNALDKHSTIITRQKAFIVGIEMPATSRHTDEFNELSSLDSLDELCKLAEAAGLEVVGTAHYRISKPSPGYLLGRGRVEELKQAAGATAADVVVWDIELSPTQERNLTRMLERPAIDRVAVILDIFANRATTPAGRLQVERAQLEFLLPRLAGHGRDLTRQGGGIGTRGPGETKLETDKRLIHKRIRFVDEKIKDLTKRRLVERSGRNKSGLPIVAIVGYTNAGKSTLLNSLTMAGVLVDNAPFATLETTIRKLRLPSGREVLLTDTVGFINRLPHQLIKAFNATLAEAAEADVWMLVLDASDPLFAEKEAIALNVLKSLGKGDKEVFILLNKTDVLPPAVLATLQRERYESAPISARYGYGLSDMLVRLDELLNARQTRLRVFLDAADGKNLAWLYSISKVRQIITRGSRLTVELMGDLALEGRLRARGLRFRHFKPGLINRAPENLDSEEPLKVAWTPALKPSEDDE